MPTASLRPRSGVAVARANRRTKERLRREVKDCAWGLVVLGCVFVVFLYLAS